MPMNKFVAVAVACLIIGAPTFASAGSKGFSGFRGSSAFKSRPVKPVDPSQHKTGSIQDLGINPSAKSPADMIKNRSIAEPQTGAAPGAAPAPQSPAPGFFGSGGFGSSWMSWAFLGYLFGRHHQAPHKAVERELELIPDPPEAE